ncbi:MAG TPA: glycosyltransferase family 39 protein, partial [Chthoniobacteraceae bacterium]|nr:glycosyltransferase family 39 protein [Chthoniobacteraceae bacterium]
MNPAPVATEASAPEPWKKASFGGRRHWWAVALLFLIAACLRFAWLGIKPPHFDEGVNGWFLDQMQRTGFYHYDPANYHGPFHFYVLFLAQSLFGRDVIALRVPLVLVNLGTLWMILLYARFVGRRVAFLAAAAFSVSSGMLFYSRYAIHEAWLVLALVVTIWGLFEWWTSASRRGVWAIVGGVTLMILTKETYVIHLAALGLACGTLRLLECWSPSEPEAAMTPAPHRLKMRDYLQPVALGLLAIFFFYSGGFFDFGALKGLYETFAPWFETGIVKGDHAKPWYYWLQLAVRHEWPALLGLLFCVRALFPGMNRFSRYLAIYGCGAAVAYSIVPYKTPWCVITILWPFFFLFGEALLAFARGGGRWRPALACLLTVFLLAFSLFDAIRLNYLHPAEPQKEVFVPSLAERWLTRAHLISLEARYIYVQTLDDLFKLTVPLKEMTRRDPRLLHEPAHILLSSYHPLPWVLGELTRVGYY